MYDVKKKSCVRAFKKANVDDSELLELIQMCQDIFTILLIVSMNYSSETLSLLKVQLSPPFQ